MHWVLQNNLFDEAGWHALVAALDRLGLPWSEHKVVPFVGELVPPATPASDNVICMGSYSMRHVARREGWSPGVFDLEPFPFPVQLAKWGAHLLNADSVVSRFADAHFTADEHFVRPITDSKSFAGRVMARAEFEAFQHAVCALGEDAGSTFTGDSVIQLATPRPLFAEYRCWFVKGELVTASLYRRGGRALFTADVPGEVCAYAEARVAEWQPHDAFVLDVCETNEGFKVVEINTLNAAGFYAADVQRLVIALEDAFSR
jgi:hypothetical protein